MSLPLENRIANLMTLYLNISTSASSSEQIGYLFASFRHRDVLKVTSFDELQAEG